MRSEATYHCPACGAPQEQTTRGNCTYCAAPRVPLGAPDPRTALMCGGCKAMVGGAVSFCPHCGDSMATFVSQSSELHCPRCQREGPIMTRYGLAPTKSMPSGHEVDGCTNCGGVWLDARTVKAMITEAEDLVGRVSIKETDVRRRVVAEASGPILYRRCPVCEEMMGRTNFERVSGIILDKCMEHGTFFDSGELHDVLNFVRSGGLILAQRKKAIEKGRLTAEEASARRSPTNQGATGLEAQGMLAMGRVESPGLLGRDVGALALALVRWGAGWAWRAGRAIADARES